MLMDVLAGSPSRRSAKPEPVACVPGRLVNAPVKATAENDSVAYPASR